MKKFSLFLIPVLALLWGFGEPQGSSLEQFEKQWRLSTQTVLSGQDAAVQRLLQQARRKGQVKGNLLSQQVEKLVFTSSQGNGRIEVLVAPFSIQKNQQRFLIETRANQGRKTTPQLAYLDISAIKIGQDDGWEIEVKDSNGQLISGARYLRPNSGTNRMCCMKDDWMKFRKPTPGSPLTSCIDDLWPTLPAFVQRMCGKAYDNCMSQNNLLGCTGMLGCAFGYFAVCFHQIYG
ncbi:MAG: hypothetical protein AAFR61_16945 [Bacteroidota bacterium]